MLPLAFVGSGSRVIIKKILGGRGMLKRLTELGLTPGSRITVLKNQMAGPLIVSVRGSQLALGRGIALKIQVEVEK